VTVVRAGSKAVGDVRDACVGRRGVKPGTSADVRSPAKAPAAAPKPHVCACVFGEFWRAQGPAARNCACRGVIVDHPVHGLQHCAGADRRVALAERRQFSPSASTTGQRIRV